MFSTPRSVPAIYVVSATIVDRHNVRHCIEKVTICTIELHTPPQFWNCGIGGGGTKCRPGPMNYILLGARKRIITTITTSQHRCDYLQACQLPVGPNYHATTRACTFGDSIATKRMTYSVRYMLHGSPLLTDISTPAIETSAPLSPIF